MVRERRTRKYEDLEFFEAYYAYGRMHQLFCG